MIIITGSVLATPETVDEIVALSLEHVHRSRTEPGCLEHGVHRDAEDPLHLIFVERWADAAAIAAHFHVPASLDFARALNRLAAEPPTMDIYDASPFEP